MGIDELLDGETDQMEVRRILTHDLTEKYGDVGFQAWNKYYRQEPSYRLTRVHYNELMVDKHIRVYQFAVEELGVGQNVR